LIDFTERFRVQIGFITFRIPDGFQGAIDSLAEKNERLTVSISKPRKPRTTGPGSQNSHSWGHIAQLARETGHEPYEIEYLAKYRAIKRGYPVNTCLGMNVPKSQSELDTVENGYLIDELHAIATENNIRLIETGEQ
jgi:hypothetical protein